MKQIKTLLVALLALFVLVGCSNGGGSSKTTVVTEVPEGTTITFWHGMNGGQEEALTKITNDFMAQNPNIKVDLQNQSSYKDLQAKLNSTMTSPKDLPTISQGYTNWFFNVAEDDILVDLKPFIENDKIGIKNVEDILPAFMDGGKINDIQYGLPFNKSTEVLFYNKDILDQYGVAVPTTMEELATASKTIFEKSGGKVVGAGFDSLNNYYAIGMENKGVDFNKDMDVAGKESLEVVKFYQDGIKEGYFRIASKGQYLSAELGAQTLAMNVGSMAGESHVRKAATDFEYGVAIRPDKKNLQQGTDIFMFTSATDEQKSAAFQYMNYLTSPEAQLHWGSETGYIPVRSSVINDEAYKTSGSKVAPLVADATKDLFILPVIENADPAYQLGRDMTEEILADASKDPQTILDSYKPKFESTWSQS